MDFQREKSLSRLVGPDSHFLIGLHLDGWSLSFDQQAHTVFKAFRVYRQNQLPSVPLALASDGFFEETVSDRKHLSFRQHVLHHFLVVFTECVYVENQIRFRREKKVVIILLIIMAILGLYAKKFIVEQDGRPLITVE